MGGSLNSTGRQGLKPKFCMSHNVAAEAATHKDYLKDGFYVNPVMLPYA
jgi:hypothetical protein